MPTPTDRRRRVRIGVAATGIVTVAALGAAALPAYAGSDEAADGKPGHGRTVDLQMLAINDFHGALEPPEGSGGQVTHEHEDGTTEQIDAGGVEYLATALRKARKGQDRSVTVAAGDMVGASPMLSGIFHDEPTIEALNKLKLDVAGVGNHEFDEGAEELKRKQNGGCHEEDGCYNDGSEFAGADFPFLAANVVDEKTKKPLLRPYTVRKMKGAKVGFIGVTLKGTAGIVAPDGIKGLEFLDEAETLSKYTKELRRKGVKAVVALVHEGGFPSSPAYNHDCDSGDGLSGPIVDIAKKTDAGVDALVTGHTHEAYVCSVPDPKGNDRMVTSAASNGRLFTELNMEYDRKTRDIVRTSVQGVNKVVDREQNKAKDLSRLIKSWDKLAAPIANRPIGHISEDITQDRTAPESPLGDLIADSQLAYAKTEDDTAELALMNPGGIRTDLVHKASGDEGDGVVTYGEAFEVQPFANTVDLMDLTGEQLLKVLREQVSGDNADVPKILQVSDGVTYTLDLTKSGEDRIVADTVKINGEALEADRTYRVAANSFLASGGDGFPTLAEGANHHVGSVDRDTLETYLTENSSEAEPLAAPAADRITVVE
ncbi:5'-nucleotidase C-terminal domain-containing protein [Streptomyces sp. XM4193]|uniref:bifunctional metallophosphatase/5'-nucleotidase n=1 Tax=Streptomyces sp. XM4193 TaxID=2929782 RepID=UPI001FFB6B26|nr:5'-nucleotidase C-terminal domain-containing protein [Streptomyces sp. XM4193]MCK1798251.1 5'-nucleotidase C-terminal domain-containing protein [Streptomyces sp. XM4193]